MFAASARAEGFREVFRNASEAAPEGSWERFAVALDDDFNTPAALAVMHEWRDHELLRRALGIFGLESLSVEDVPPDDVVTLAKRRQEARAARGLGGGGRGRGGGGAAGRGGGG